MSDAKEAKASLRQAALARRDAMPEDVRIEASLIVADRCAELLPITPGMVVSGFLPIRSLGERPKVEGATLTVRAGKRQLSFTEGYAIGIRVKEVDFLRLQVMLELA